MSAILEIASKNIGYIIALVTGLATMYGWIVKPIRAIQAENKKQTEKLMQLDDDTADLLCSQLIRERDFYMRQGWCPPLDKDRLAGVYRRYKSRGRNHVADHYIDDILNLPDWQPRL